MTCSDAHSHQLSVSFEACQEAVSADEFVRLFQRRRVTVWIARHQQLSEILAFAHEVTRAHGISRVIIVPVRSAAEFEHVAKTLSAFETMFGVTPVAAFAPPGLGLLAMSTPPSRSVSKKTHMPVIQLGELSTELLCGRASLESRRGSSLQLVRLLSRTETVVWSYRQ